MLTNFGQALAALVVIVVFCVWTAGTVFIWQAGSFKPGVCTAPYHTYALTWPLFRVAPMDFLVWTQDMAFKVCDLEKAG